MVTIVRSFSTLNLAMSIFSCVFSYKLLIFYPIIWMLVRMEDFPGVNMDGHGRYCEILLYTQFSNEHFFVCSYKLLIFYPIIWMLVGMEVGQTTLCGYMLQLDTPGRGLASQRRGRVIKWTFGKKILL